MSAGILAGASTSTLIRFLLRVGFCVVEFIVSWLISAFALVLASNLFESVRLSGDFSDALWVAALFNVLSFLFGWFFFVVLGFATLGLGFVFHFVTRLVAAAIVIKLTSSLSKRFSVEGAAPALGTAIFLAVGTSLVRPIVAFLP